ncbi:MAG: hypothetical protein PUF50_05035 [Erysipelotrichaceae bacterium]|nr:hypothetical protein [Erysipelotrichaceae bacterium]
MNMKIEDYTEKEYYSFAQLEKHFSTAHAKELYQQILQYRKPYQRMIPNGYYVACNQLLEQVYECYEILLMKKQKVYDGHGLIVSVIEKVSKGNHEIFDSFMECLKSSLLPEALEKLGDIFGYHSSAMNQYLCKKENPILKICCVIQTYFYQSSAYTFFLIVSILYHHDLLSSLYVFEPKALKHLKFHQEKEDKTKIYLLILQWLQVQLEKDMVSYSWIPENEKELVEYYPFLLPQQATFYLQHNRPNHYYTIQQYIEANEVCYETGRIQMEQFVKMGWYKKKKVGKKFVYSV